MNQFRNQKIRRTSFRDASFIKVLESALRFGTALLVEDVEGLDPILNPVLNREIRKSDGRILVRLGDQDVTFSPSFVIILSTRESNPQFTPDLCSRVTFVNFTVTPNSLQSQCLDSILRVEQPETYNKRQEWLSLDGEYQKKLRSLEAELLDVLNRCSDQVLENDTVLSALEQLKTDATLVEQKVAHLNSVSHLYIVSRSPSCYSGNARDP
jgi:dynein heavy chain 1